MLRVKTATLLVSVLFSPAALAMQTTGLFNGDATPNLTSGPEFATFSILTDTSDVPKQPTFSYPAIQRKAAITEAGPVKTKPSQLKVWRWYRNTPILEQLGQDSRSREKSPSAN